MTNSHNNRLTTFLRRLLSPRFLYFYAVLSLAVPNVALCFTERMPFMACLANVLLPLGVYGGLCRVRRAARFGASSCLSSSPPSSWCLFIFTDEE